MSNNPAPSRGGTFYKALAITILGTELLVLTTLGQSEKLHLGHSSKFAYVLRYTQYPGIVAANRMVSELRLASGFISDAMFFSICFLTQSVIYFLLFGSLTATV
jgi:hypothetical protein